MIKKLIATFFIVISFQCFADPLNELEDLAQKGDPAAQTVLGVLYYNGQNVQQDYNKAVYWLQKAEQQNHPSAQALLGRLYFSGTAAQAGIPRDDQKAQELFEKAAQQQNSEGMYGLGLLFHTQNKRDLSREWLEKAAHHEHSDAQYLIGNSYYNETNYPLALQWLTKAADQEHATAQYTLGLMYLKGEGVKEDVKHAQLLFYKAANQNNSKAQLALGLLYQSGHGTPKDEKKALYWLEKAAHQNELEAQYLTGYLIATNEDDNALPLARQWFTIAAERGHAKAQRDLALLYYILDSNFNQATFWAKKACDNSEQSSCDLLKEMASQQK